MTSFLEHSLTSSQFYLEDPEELDESEEDELDELDELDESSSSELELLELSSLFRSFLIFRMGTFFPDFLEVPGSVLIVTGFRLFREATADARFRRSTSEGPPLPLRRIFRSSI